MSEQSERMEIASTDLFGIHTLSNGRIYMLSDRGPYISGEYPSGGVHIVAWEPRCNGGQWVYIDYAPDEECARAFLDHARRLPYLPNSVLCVTDPSSTTMRQTGRGRE
jgi:hypothetical protein